MIRYGGQIANIPKIAAQDTVTALTVSKVNGGKMKFFCSIRDGSRTSRFWPGRQESS